MGLLSKEEYDAYCNRFNTAYKYLQSVSYDSYDVVSKICEMRGYSKGSQMFDMLIKAGFVYLKPESVSFDVLRKIDKDGDLGLFNEKSGNFRLLNRFIFPVRDMLSNVIALIGWFPDEKKYITTPSKLFSKKCLFYGMEQLSKTGIGSSYFLVEGIFDALSLRSLGYNCVAMMGISASRYTEVLYTLFKNIVAIPDNDFEGRRVITEDRWKLPTSNGKYVRIKGNCKDIDDVIKSYDVSGVFNDIWSEFDRIITIEL